MGLIYTAALSLVGFMILAVVVDAVMTASKSQKWPEIRLQGQPAPAATTLQTPAAPPAEPQPPQADWPGAVAAKPAELGKRNARKDEALEAV